VDTLLNIIYICDNTCVFSMLCTCIMQNGEIKHIERQKKDRQGKKSYLTFNTPITSKSHKFKRKPYMRQSQREVGY